MLVNFITKEEIKHASIELITSIILDGQLNNIYKYTDTTCEQTFITPFTYIGYFKDNEFYVVNLKDDVFPDDFKDEFKFFDKELGLWRRLLPNIKNFKFIEFPLPCRENTINLDNARSVIDELNIKLDSLNLRLGCNYKLELNYLFQMGVNTEINKYKDNDYITSDTLLLCIFVNNVCVSSLTIEYENNAIIYESKTKKEYENNKLNKLLRSVLIIISKQLYPDAESVDSDAVNPTSYWLMKKYFNAIARNTSGKAIELKTYEDIKNYMEAKKLNVISSSVDLSISEDKDNIANAKRVFENIIKDELRCVKQIIGGKRKRTNRKRTNRKGTNRKRTKRRIR
jgi:hypothetical protein